MWKMTIVQERASSLGYGTYESQMIFRSKYLTELSEVISKLERTSPDGKTTYILERDAEKEGEE